MSGGRADRARRQAWISAALGFGVLVAVLALLDPLRARLDLTENREYTLDPATRELLGELQDRLQIKLYFNRDIEGAEALLPQRLAIQDLLSEIEAAGAPWVAVETVDPTTDLVAQRDAEHVGVEPLPLTGQDVAGVSLDLLYQGLEMRYQDRSEVIPFVVPAEFEFAFAVRLAALLEPERPVIGLASREPPLPPQVPGMPRQIPEGRVFEELRVTLGRRYAVRDVDLADAGTLDGLVALILARPQDLAEEERRAVDRYLAEGGHLLVLHDHEIVAPDTLRRTPIDSGLTEWLAGHGVLVQEPFVFDERGLRMQVGVRPVETPQGRVAQPITAEYGLAPVVTGDGLDPEHVVTAGLDRVTLFWAHPVAVRGLPEGVEADTLLRSSDRAWAMAPDVSLDFAIENAERLRGMALSSGPGRSYALGVALRGGFAPAFAHDDLQPAPGLLVVIGDSEIFHNSVLQQQSAAENRALAANLLDWMAQDEGLIRLRSRGRDAREIVDFAERYVEEHGGFGEDEEANRALDRAARRHARAWQRGISWGNVLVPPLLVLLAAQALRMRRRRRARARAASPAKGARGGEERP